MSKQKNDVEPLIAPLTPSWARDKVTFSLILLSAVMCLVASLVLSIDAFVLASNPNAELSCDFNDVISCGTVALSPQTQILGFPNSFFGLIAEPVIIFLALAGLSKIRFPRWLMTVVQSLYLIGLVFALWLFYQSAYVINALCPWCMIVTICTSITFFTLLRYNILHENLYLPETFSTNLRKLLAMKLDYVVVWCLLLTLGYVVFSNYGLAVFGL